MLHRARDQFGDVRSAQMAGARPAIEITFHAAAKIPRNIFRAIGARLASPRRAQSSPLRVDLAAQAGLGVASG